MSVRSESESGQAIPARRTGVQWKMILVCSLVWTLLWSDLSIANVLAGALLGLVVTTVFPLPPVEFHGRFRPWGHLVLIFRLLVDLVTASLAVVATAFRFGSTPKSAIIAVPLRSDSDLYLTMTAELVSLVPGSIVLEARRSSRTLYLHVFDVRSDVDLATARQSVRDVEARVLLAYGSQHEYDAVLAERLSVGDKTSGNKVSGSNASGDGPSDTTGRDS